ncbi:hypothetical protein SeMB42_g07032 [Synchytrium endobioticum]|nr:hypothetical protein SeMB42_g07032 [Synchytrium endobioticum]
MSEVQAFNLKHSQTPSNQQQYQTGSVSDAPVYPSNPITCIPTPPASSAATSPTAPQPASQNEGESTTRKSRRGAAMAARHNITAAVKGKTIIDNSMKYSTSPIAASVSHTTPSSNGRTRSTKSSNKKTSKVSKSSCPTCHKSIVPSQAHTCVQPTGPGQDDESYETYTWAGMTRIRTTTLLESQNYVANGWSVHKRTDRDVDEDVDIEIEPSAQFGGAQFSEEDLKQYYLDRETDEPGWIASGQHSGEGYEDAPVPPSSANANDDDGGAVLTGGIQFPPLIDSRTLKSGSHNAKTVCVDIEGDGLDEADVEHAITNAPPDYKLAFDALKTRLRALEDAQTHQSVKCLICLDPYVDPCVCTTCWHVHCQSCWLQTIAAKRLCPQCQKIVSPADLRRIYL